MFKVGDRVFVIDVKDTFVFCQEGDTGTVVKVDPFGKGTYLVKVDNPIEGHVHTWGFEEHQLVPILFKGAFSKCLQ